HGGEFSQINWLFSGLLVSKERFSPPVVQRPVAPVGVIRIVSPSGNQQTPSHQMDQLKFRMSGEPQKNLASTTPIKRFNKLPGFAFFHDEVLKGVEQLVRDIRGDRSALFLLRLRPLVSSKLVRRSLLELFEALPKVRQYLLIERRTQGYFTNRLELKILNFG